MLISKQKQCFLAICSAKELEHYRFVRQTFEGISLVAEGKGKEKAV